MKPDLVVISGDFTQRARTEQFKEACEFLDRLRDAGHEVLGVPGNHDVPLYDVLRRFLSPLTRYRRFIDDKLCPFHELPGAAVLGINTARSLTFKDGRINHEQIDFIRETFARTAAGCGADPGHAPSAVRAPGRRRAGARQGDRPAGDGARRDRRRRRRPPAGRAQPSRLDPPRRATW